MRVWGYSSIFTEISILSLDLEIPYIGIIKPQEVGFDIKICLGYESGAYMSILPLMSTSAFEFKVAYLGVIKYQGMSSNFKISVRLDCQHVDFPKIFNLIP